MHNIDVRKTKTLKKEIKELNQWREIPCAWTGIYNAVKISALFFFFKIY